MNSVFSWIHVMPLEG